MQLDSFSNKNSKLSPLFQAKAFRNHIILETVSWKLSYDNILHLYDGSRQISSLFQLKIQRNHLFLESVKNVTISNWKQTGNS